MSVPYPVRTGQSDHRSRKFSVLTVFVGEFCCVEEASDLLIADIIIAPFKDQPLQGLYLCPSAR